MPKGGKLSLDMMYRTCGIQINYDYTSEKNFEKIFRVGNYLAPLTIAIFANSPFKDKKPSKDTKANKANGSDNNKTTDSDAKKADSTSKTSANKEASKTASKNNSANTG